MAKYKRYRNYNRRNRPRWSANITHVVGEILSAPNASQFFNTFVLCTNPIQANTSVPQTFTVKNVEFTGAVESSNSITTIEGLCAFVMYVPEGMTIPANYESAHPEYIMAYKYYGTPSPDGQQQFQPIRVKTRLARTLQTGDSIVLFVKGYNVGTTSANLEVSGLVRWWSKAN